MTHPKEFTVIRVNDKYLSEYKMVRKSNVNVFSAHHHGYVSEPKDAYHWTSMEFAINCANDLKKANPADRVRVERFAVLGLDIQLTDSKEK